MQTKKEKNKSWINIIGSLFIFAGLCLIVYDFTTKEHIKDEEKAAIENYKITEKIDNENIEEPQEQVEVKQQTNIEYIAILKIPKINLERGLVNRNSYLNNVNYNVEIVKDSSMPDELNGNVILAAHSGNARVSYFRNLDKLSINDKVSIDYKGITYNYHVVNIYDIEKTGTALIKRNYNTSTLTLITCRHNTNKQIVVICELEK
ncbi:MAG: sortase [Clostridia bacterium]|nr:sortase [Clostridia bacterium]MBO5530555.1 sortase [Bacilli bacterium]